MKMNSLKAAAAIGLSALAIGSAAAQDAASKPVGYETLDYGVGFTGIGIRLHQAPVTSGVVASADATSITVTDADFDSLLTAGANYVLEIENAKGIVQVVNAWAGSSITTPSDLSTEIVAGETTFTIRPVDTLESVFGSGTALSIAAGNGNAGGADEVWVSDGAGGYDKYYFDNFAPPTFASASWVKIGDGVVDGSAVNLLYPDGIVMNSPSGGSVVVTGSVKLSSTELTLLQGFTFVSSVAPAGANLATAFGADAASLALSPGNGNAGGADEIWVQNASGDYDKYYFDNFAPPTFASASWVQIGGGAVDGATIDLPSGFVVNSPAGGNVTQGVPAFYAGL
jgi:hypothetical protein